MKNLKLIFGVAAIAIGSMVAFSFGPSKEAAKKESKVAMYWFDASSGAYLRHSEASGCDLSNSNPCAVGYISVANPSNPQKPTSQPDDQKTGEYNPE